VPENYNWNTKGVQIEKRKKKKYFFQKISQFFFKKWDPLLDVLIPELFDDLQSDT
jgi:hypothetical protein